MLKNVNELINHPVALPAAVAVAVIAVSSVLLLRKLFRPT